MNYSHEDIEELLGAYALDAVDPDERDAVEAHLPTCPRCAAEVSDHREVAAMLAHTGAPAPDGLWDRIQDSLEEAPPAMTLSVQQTSDAGEPSITEEATDGEGSTVVPLSGARRTSGPRGSRRRWLPIGAAAAAAVVIIGLFVGVVSDDTEPVDERPELAAPTLDEVARRAFNDPQARKATLSSNSGELTAPVAIEPDGTGYLLATSLPSLDPEHTYQLWGVKGDLVVSLGVLGSSPGVVAFSTDESVEALAITREVAGGVVSSSNDPVLVGTVS